MANGRNGVPGSLQQGVQHMYGTNLADVRVHTNSAQPRQIQAHAYAQGSATHVATGNSQKLPHEMSHVVQQRQGQVAQSNAIGGAMQNKGRK